MFYINDLNIPKAIIILVRLTDEEFITLLNNCTRIGYSGEYQHISHRISVYNYILFGLSCWNEIVHKDDIVIMEEPVKQTEDGYLLFEDDDSYQEWGLKILNRLREYHRITLL